MFLCLIIRIIKNFFFLHLNKVSCICDICFLTFGHHWESVSCFFTIPHQLYIHIDQSHAILPFSILNNLTFVSSFRCSSSLNILIAPLGSCCSMHLLLRYWGVQSWIQDVSRCLISAEQRGRIIFLPGNPFCSTVQGTVVLLATGAHCLFMVNVLSVRTFRAFNAKVHSLWPQIVLV